MAAYAQCRTPVTDGPFSVSARANAISVAPPPGIMRGSNNTLRTTAILSCKLRSTYQSINIDSSIKLINRTSFIMSLLAPRTMIVQAFESSHSVTYLQFINQSNCQ